MESLAIKDIIVEEGTLNLYNDTQERRSNRC